MAYARPAFAPLDAPAAASACCTPSNVTVLGRDTGVHWIWCQGSVPSACAAGTGACH